MKPLLFLLLCMFIFGHTQAQIPGINPSVKSASKLQSLPNGKYLLSKAISYNTNGKWSINGKEEKPTITKAEKVVNPKDASVQTHHIIFHFDRFADAVWCNGPDTLFTDFWNMTWTANNTLEGDLTDGYYELVSVFTKWSTFLCVAKKDFHVYKDMDTTILSTSANHTLNLILNDKNGNPVTYPTGLNGDGFACSFEFPDTFKSPFLSITYSGMIPLAAKFTDVSPEIKVSLGRMDATRSEPYHFYVVSYPVLQGINSDTTLQNNAADLQHFPLVFRGTPGGKDYFLGWGYGTVANDSLLGGPADPFVLAFLSDSYPGKAIDTIQFYTTNIAIDTNKVFFGTGIDHYERNLSDLTYADFMTPILYLTTQNNLILSTEGNYPPVPSDYRVVSENPIEFGSTAPFNVTWGFNSAELQQINLLSHFRAQKNERRYIDVGMGTYEIWEGNVKLVYDSLRTFNIVYNTLDLGVYSVILNDSNYTILGRNGFMQTNLTFNLSESDVNSPTLLAFKIRKADSISNELIHGYDASVTFTAADYTFPGTMSRMYHSLEEVHLYYKEYSESNWYEVPVSAQFDLLDSISGMPYFADLAQMMNQFPDSVWIDLKIVLIDSSGNSNTQTMHPACLVRDALVGTGTVSRETFFKIYPNPASDKLHIFTNADHFSVSVYTVTGQLVMERSDCRWLNVTGLENGLYLVRLTNNKDLQSSLSKFVK